MNLLTNASDALGDNPGRITVRVRRVSEVDARWDQAQGATVGPGRWVLVEVEDTGIGMDEPTRGRVFEPFFSTKERGHGLGLAACLGIVRAHGGAVLVESELGRGSRFSVVLPASERSDARSTPTPARRARRRAPAACSSSTTRRSCGASCAGRSSCAAIRSSRRPTVTPRWRRFFQLAAVAEAGPLVDVVVLDMTMPDLDGAEVLRRAARRRLARAGRRLVRVPRRRRRAAPAPRRVPGLPGEALQRDRARERHRTRARPRHDDERLTRPREDPWSSDHRGGYEQKPRLLAQDPFTTTSRPASRRGP